MTTPFFFVGFFTAIQCEQDRQGKRAIAIRNINEDCQYDPLVTIVEHCVGMRTANGIAMASFAVDFFAAMSINRFITANSNDTCRCPAINHKPGDHAGDRPTAPAAVRKHVVISRKVY